LGIFTTSRQNLVARKEKRNRDGEKLGGPGAILPGCHSYGVVGGDRGKG